MYTKNKKCAVNTIPSLALEMISLVFSNHVNLIAADTIVLQSSSHQIESLKQSSLEAYTPIISILQSAPEDTYDYFSQLEARSRY